MSESVRKEGIELLVLGQLNISNLISIVPGSTFIPRCTFKSDINYTRENFYTREHFKSDINDTREKL